MTGPGDSSPFTTFNDQAKSPVLLVADHASPHIPACLDQLGLADWVLDRHVAWDIGSFQLAQFLATELDARAVLAGFSRLLIDPNRHPESKTSIPEVSDGIAIPGNTGLDEQQKTRRIQSFFNPYHDAIAEALAQFGHNGIVPAVISVHSFSPILERKQRPWHVGIMWDKDPRIPVPLINGLRQLDGICVGDNEPYSGRHPHDYTIDYHAEAAGLPHVGIEVRQDLVKERDGARKWAGILAGQLGSILSNDQLYQRFPEPGDSLAE